MKTLSKYTLLLVVMLSGSILNAQQNSLFNTYSLDPLQLNIAYAGAACTEANAHYRSQWIGMKEAPKVLQLNVHSALGKSNALGLRVNSQTQGLLNTLQATLGYAYRFRVSEHAKVHLGLGIGWTQAALNAQKAIVIDASDATLGSGNRQTANGFDSEFGVMLVGDKLKAGISAFHLYNSNPNFSGNNTYKTLPQLNTQVSYLFNKDKKVEVEPWLLSRYTVNGNNVIEGMLNIHFVKAITIGAGYRSSYGVIGLLGAKVGNVKLAYSFDYGVSKNATNTGSSHQIMLGFNMCKTAKPSKIIEEPIVVVTPSVMPTVEEVKEEPVVAQEEAKQEVKQKQGSLKKESVVPKMNVIAEKVVFKLNKSKLNSEGLRKIDEIAAIMKTDPSLKINIIGHTCEIGTEEANEILSENRAAYVKNELIKRGIKPENINQTVGVGANRQLFSKPENKEKNRTIRFETAR